MSVKADYLVSLVKKLGLTKAQLRNPRVQQLLADHMQKVDGILAEPTAPEMPTAPPGAVNHCFGWNDYLKSNRKK